MKVILSLTSLHYSFNAGKFIFQLKRNCSVHNTTIVHDTNVITLRDTIKLTFALCRNPNDTHVNSYYSTKPAVEVKHVVTGA